MGSDTAWMDRRRSVKLYTAREKELLINRLLELRDRVSWTGVYNTDSVSSEIPSRRTLYRIFGDPDNYQIRDTTARQIENLLTAIDGRIDGQEPNPLVVPQLFSLLSQSMALSSQTSREFLERYNGCYKCVRVTTDSKQILVTHLRIHETTPDIPCFTHIESVPDEASAVGGRGRRILMHEGVILARQRRATFLSPSGYLRQMTCVISTNSTRPAFSGLLLSVDAIRELPFAARVFLVCTEEITDDDVIGHPDYGLFEADSQQYASFMPYISNAIDGMSVLCPENQV